ncbi:MAG: hypothetical protein U0V56_07395 [Actinomycetota bacterium]
MKISRRRGVVQLAQDLGDVATRGLIDLEEDAPERQLHAIGTVEHDQVPPPADLRVHLDRLERHGGPVLAEPLREVLLARERLEDQLAGCVEDPDDRDAAGVAVGRHDPGRTGCARRPIRRVRSIRHVSLLPEGIVLSPERVAPDLG